VIVASSERFRVLILVKTWLKFCGWSTRVSWRNEAAGRDDSGTDQGNLFDEGFPLLLEIGFLSDPRCGHGPLI